MLLHQLGKICKPLGRCELGFYPAYTSSIGSALQSLHLHPLTLEDILQRDPHEKLELFPRLGYYFLSFRAIESQGAKDIREKDNYTDDSYHSRQDDGFIGAANVYMVVFKEGICSVSNVLITIYLLMFHSFTLQTYQVRS